MTRRLLLSVLGVLVLLVVVPVLVTQLREEPQRRFEYTRLADTHHREVRFRNEEQDLELAGLLFVPRGPGPFPAAVVIHGSGMSRRDNGWYLTLVEHLQRNGVAVLLPDKRGSEQSAGDWRTAGFDDLATDTVAALQYLRQQEAVAVSQIGVIGLSQGGHIAPLVASRAPEVAFVVNVVGSSLPMHELLVYEENQNLRGIGLLPGLSDVLARPAAWSVRQRQRSFWEAVGNFDPLPYWRVLSVPALVLYGEDDTNVPSGRSAARLRELENPNIEVRIYAGSGHALALPVGEGDSIFRPDVLRDLQQFILEHAVAVDAQHSLPEEATGKLAHPPRNREL
jgi:dienelactone hydrolase